jgi:hypothetical protein
MRFPAGRPEGPGAALPGTNGCARTEVGYDSRPLQKMYRDLDVLLGCDRRAMLGAPAARLQTGPQTRHLAQTYSSFHAIIPTIIHAITNIGKITRGLAASFT